MPRPVRCSPAPQIRIVADLYAALLEVLAARSSRGVEGVRGIVLAARREPPATPGFHGLLMGILLEAYAGAGEAEAGLAATDEALAMGGGTQLWEAEIHRLRAGFLAALGAPEQEVEAELRRAIEVARRQAARAFERRAHAELEAHRAGTA